MMGFKINSRNKNKYKRDIPCHCLHRWDALGWQSREIQLGSQGATWLRKITSYRPCSIRYGEGQITGDAPSEETLNGAGQVIKPNNGFSAQPVTWLLNTVFCEM